ncbi:unnamed protein product, partial [Medioppia subpectinata]
MSFKPHFVFILSSLWFSSTVFGTERPQQVHISLGADPTEMVVTWVTEHHISGKPCVEYGETDLSMKAFGKSYRFVDGGPEKRHFFNHRVKVKDLKAGHKYQYHCGSDEGWSSVFTFSTLKAGTEWSPRLAVFGDMGAVNAQSFPRLEQDVRRHRYDAIIHVGDFAYDMDSDNARVGDQFMRLIEPIAAVVPYQVCPGNHENKYNFSNYDNRFSMVDTTSGHVNNHYYSFNIGPAHFVSLSTEFYYFTEFGWYQIGRQFRWLEADLRAAAAPEARHKRPWIIVVAHRPLYCQTDAHECSPIGDHHSSSLQRKRLRTGIKIKNAGNAKYGLEELFHKYNVDIQLYGHEHNYQRLLPLYDNEIMNGSQSHPYVNPKASVAFVTGSAGCSEKHSKFIVKPKWSAFRSSDYGFTRMTIHNKTHISMEQVSDDQ